MRIFAILLYLSAMLLAQQVMIPDKAYHSSIIATNDRTYQVVYIYAKLYEYLITAFSTTCGFNYYKMRL